ncbi:MAG TPA: hypothetical protein VJ860_07275 [Polyangia bacterium]|nr:hypothetical protein [Polyangia bacterium]
MLSRVPASLPDEKKAADAMQARLCAVVKKFAQGQDVTLIVAGDLLDLSLAYPIWSAPWSIAQLSTSWSMRLQNATEGGMAHALTASAVG